MRVSKDEAQLPPRGATVRTVAEVRSGGEPRSRHDALAIEEPLEIRVDGETLAVTMRTPGQDADLALGFLFAEGVIAGVEDVGAIAHCGRPGQEGYGNVIDVRSAGGTHIDTGRVLEGRRWEVTSSACGVCGRRSIEGLLERCRRVETREAMAAQAVSACVERLSSAQPIFSRTGGLHAAALFSAGGELLLAAEDVGRHNAVDKVVGALLRRRAGEGPGREASPALLAVSGRSSFEIVQKAAAAGIALVASVSAPSSLAVDLAEAAGVTLLGFVRDGRMNAYAHGWRVGRLPPAG